LEEISMDNINPNMSNEEKEKLINSLSKEDKAKLNEVLNDKEKLNDILKSPMAKALMKQFLKGGKNG
jgi:hypothetical protein